MKVSSILFKQKYVAPLALITFVLAFIVILLGGYTRLTDAGLSCPDWPHCYGNLTAPHTEAQLAQAAQQYPDSPVNIKKAWTEMTHRYCAGAEGLLILMLVTLIAYTKHPNDLTAGKIASTLVILLAIQILLGMFTITEKLRPIIVLSHLLTGLSILAMVWRAYLHFSLPHKLMPTIFRPHVLYPFLCAGILIVIIQIALGGWVSTHYAGLACVDFPFCNGQLLPQIEWHDLNNDLVSIHMLHRIGAAITAFYTAILAYIIWREPAFKQTAGLVLLLILVQLFLGVLNIILLRPVGIALLHQGIAITLLLTLFTLLTKVSLLRGNSHAILST